MELSLKRIKYRSIFSKATFQRVFSKDQEGATYDDAAINLFLGVFLGGFPATGLSLLIPIPGVHEILTLLIMFGAFALGTYLAFSLINAYDRKPLARGYVKSVRQTNSARRKLRKTLKDETNEQLIAALKLEHHLSHPAWQLSHMSQDDIRSAKRKVRDEIRRLRKREQDLEEVKSRDARNDAKEARAAKASEETSFVEGQIAFISEETPDQLYGLQVIDGELSEGSSDTSVTLHDVDSLEVTMNEVQDAAR